MKITGDILILTNNFPTRADSINKPPCAICPCLFRLELYSRVKGALFAGFTKSAHTEHDVTLLILFHCLTCFLVQEERPGGQRDWKALAGVQPCPDMGAGETGGAWGRRAGEAHSLWENKSMGRRMCTLAIKWDLNNSVPLSSKVSKI